MKRVSFCSFALVFWLIAFSTLFSIRVEQWMTPVVTTNGTNQFDELSLSCLRWEQWEGEEMMIPHLFTLQEGTDWSLGTRSREYPASQYTILPETISVLGGYGVSFIQYSTKEVENGGLVEKKVGKTETLPDDLLIFGEENSDPVLLENEEVEQPFMENREINKREVKRVFSMNEVTDFFGALLALSVIPAEFFFLLGLWAASFRLAKAPRKNRIILGVNILLSLLMLGSLPLIFHAVTLPQSLLPHEVIVEIGHYTGEFSEIFSSLERFAAQGNQTAGRVLSQVHTSIWICLGILLAGAAAGVGSFFFETARKSRKPEKTGKTAGKSKQKHIPRHGRA